MDNEHCRNCEQTLMEMDFNTKYYVYVCDNWHCHLYRQPQANRAKEPALVVEQNRRWQSPYEAYKEQKRQRYHLLRDAGIPPTTANKMTSNKQTRLELEWKAA